MSGYTTPAPYVVSASSDGGGGPLTEAWRAFDTNPNLAWISQNTGTPQYLQFDWNVFKIRLLRYSVFCNQTFTDRYPRDWTIEGSDDLITWHVLSTVTNQTNWLLTFDGVVVTASTGGISATLTLTGHTVSADDIGRQLTISGGTNFINGGYTVQSVNVGTNQWTLNAIATTGVGSGMQGQFNRRLRFFNYDVTTTAYRYSRMNITANNGSAQFVSVTDLDLAVGGGIFNRVY